MNKTSHIYSSISGEAKTVHLKERTKIKQQRFFPHKIIRLKSIVNYWSIFGLLSTGVVLYRLLFYRIISLSTLRFWVRVRNVTGATPILVDYDSQFLYQWSVVLSSFSMKYHDSAESGTKHQSINRFNLFFVMTLGGLPTFKLKHTEIGNKLIYSIKTT